MTARTCRAWNGGSPPPIPAWFRAQLKSLDPTLELQFIPPDWADPDGVPERIYPYGVYDICYRLPKSNLLHPKVVYSLANSEGMPCPPGPSIIRLLRIAKYLCLRGEHAKLRQTMDAAVTQYKSARARESKAEAHDACQKFCSVNFNRQWSNRVYLREEVPK